MAVCVLGRAWYARTRDGRQRNYSSFLLGYLKFTFLIRGIKIQDDFNNHFNCILSLLPFKLEYQSEIRGFITAMFLCFLRRIHMNNQYTVMKWNTWVVDFSDSNFTGSKNKESFLSMHVYKIDMVVYDIEIFLNSHGPTLACLQVIVLQVNSITLYLCHSLDLHWKFALFRVGLFQVLTVNSCSFTLISVIFRRVYGKVTCLCFQYYSHRKDVRMLFNERNDSPLSEMLTSAFEKAVPYAYDLLLYRIYWWQIALYVY